MKFLLLILLIASCSSTNVELNPAGMRVKMANRLPPYGHCREIGEVYGMGKSKSDDLVRIVKSARNDIRNMAAQKGANYINLETNNTVQFSGQAEVVLSGMAFRCGAKTKSSKTNKDPE